MTPEQSRQLQLLRNNLTVFTRRSHDPNYSGAEQDEARAQAEATQRQIEALSR